MSSSEDLGVKYQGKICTARNVDLPCNYCKKENEKSNFIEDWDYDTTSWGVIHVSCYYDKRMEQDNWMLFTMLSPIIIGFILSSVFTLAISGIWSHKLLADHLVITIFSILGGIFIGVSIWFIFIFRKEIKIVLKRELDGIMKQYKEVKND